MPSSWRHPYTRISWLGMEFVIDKDAPSCVADVPCLETQFCITAHLLGPWW